MEAVFDSLHLYLLIEFMKVIILFFFLCCISLAFCQDESYDVRINHHQRKLTLNYIPMPNSTFKPDDFQIKFPDSIYNKAHIEVKKLKVLASDQKLLKRSYIILTSEEKVIQTVGIAINPRFVDRFEAYLKENYDFKISEDSKDYEIKSNGEKVTVKKQKLKRQVNYQFLLP